MDGSSGHVMQLSTGGGGPGCVQSGPIPIATGVIPTLVIASSTERCRDDDREHKGIVFYDSEPVAWVCLSDAEVVEFKTWGARTFPSVQIVTVTSPLPKINCPPPSIASPRQHAAIVEAIRDELRSLAPHWFVPATPTVAAKLVA